MYLQTASLDTAMYECFALICENLIRHLGQLRSQNHNCANHVYVCLWELGWGREEKREKEDFICECCLEITLWTRNCDHQNLATPHSPNPPRKKKGRIIIVSCAAALFPFVHTTEWGNLGTWCLVRMMKISQPYLIKNRSDQMLT